MINAICGSSFMAMISSNLLLNTEFMAFFFFFQYSIIDCSWMYVCAAFAARSFANIHFIVFPHSFPLSQREKKRFTMEHQLPFAMPYIK